MPVGRISSLSSMLRAGLPSRPMAASRSITNSQSGSVWAMNSYEIAWPWLDTLSPAVAGFTPKASWITPKRELGP